MIRSLTPLASCVCLVLALDACGEFDDSRALEPGLHLELDGGELRGSLVEDGHVLQFWTVVEGEAFDLRVELNGMTLTAKNAKGVLRYAGYASENGAVTHMGDDDRAALAALSHALDAFGTGARPPVSRLRSFASRWSEYPSTMELSGEVDTSFRAYTSICEYMNDWAEATHDDGLYERWDDRTTLYAWVSMHAAGPCDDDTWFWKDGEWQCYEPDHDPSVEYAYGQCFGRCGAGCGEDSKFTYDCLDHDACVRFGHSITSLWCDDEFATTADDWALAPNCL